MWKKLVMRISRKLFPIRIMIDQNQPEHVNYFRYICSMITNDARCTHETQDYRDKRATQQEVRYFTRKLDLYLRKKLVNYYIWSIEFYGADTWRLREVDQKHLKSFEMGCWRRMEKIILTDCVRN